MLGARFLMQVNKRKGIIWRQSLFHDVEHSGYFQNYYRYVFKTKTGNA